MNGTLPAEQPLVLEVSGEAVVCMLTRQPAPGTGTAILLPGGGRSGTMSRGGAWIRMARALGRAGVTVLRIDYIGSGESTGEVRPFRLDAPDVSTARTAGRWLSDNGMPPTAIVGSCFGARTALAAASAMPSVHTLVLESMPVRDYRIGAIDRAVASGPGSLASRTLRWSTVAGLLDVRRRAIYRAACRTAVRRALARTGLRVPGVAAQPVSRQIVRALEALAGDGRRVHVIYGDADEELSELRASRAILGLLERMDAELVTLDGHLHYNDRHAVQDRLITLVVERLAAAS